MSGSVIRIPKGKRYIPCGICITLVKIIIILLLYICNIYLYIIKNVNVL